MPEFIGRPRFFEGLWGKAIDLAAQQANPFVEAVDKGLAGLEQGLSLLAKNALERELTERQAAAGAAKMEKKQAFEREQQEHLFRQRAGSEVSRLIGRGFVPTPMERGFKEVGPRPVFESGARPKTPIEMAQEPGTIPDILRGRPSQMTLTRGEPPSYTPAWVAPEGAITTHELQRMQGLIPIGENLALTPPMPGAKTAARFDEWVKKFNFRMGASGLNPKDVLAGQAAMREYLDIRPKPDISEDDFLEMQTRFVQAAKADRLGQRALKKSREALIAESQAKQATAATQRTAQAAAPAGQSINIDAIARARAELARRKKEGR